MKASLKQNGTATWMPGVPVPARAVASERKLSCASHGNGGATEGKEMTERRVVKSDGIKRGDSQDVVGSEETPLAKGGKGALKERRR